MHDTGAFMELTHVEGLKERQLTASNLIDQNSSSEAIRRVSKNELRDAAASLMPKVTRSPAIESAWLSALSRLESIAAAQIRTNISAFTPDAERVAIEEHAADEDRHAQALIALRPIADLPDERHRVLEHRLCHLAEQFVIGYFGNPLLIMARNKHAAYAHGALTIEQFPFQVYVSYLKVTQLAQVKKALPTIIREEQAHLALGRRLIEQLPSEQRLSVERLQFIEEEMCARMLRRMDAVITEFLSEPANEVPGQDTFEVAISRSHAATIAWANTLSYAEELAASHMQRIFADRDLEQPAMMPAHVADEMRHAKMLKRSILLERRRLSRRDACFNPLERGFMRGMRLYQMKLFSAVMKRTSDLNGIYLYGGLALEMRVFKHYKDLAQATDHIGFGHVLSVILDEEAEHTRQASAAIREHGLSMNDFREISRLEKLYWDELMERSTADFDRYLNSQRTYTA